MFLIENEQQLLSFFRECDQDEVILSEDLRFPIKVKDYLSWLEPSGCRAYLVFKDVSFKVALGLAFRRDQTLGPASAAMCEWCHSVRSGNEVGILTATSTRKKRVGISLCRDLSCAEKIRATPGASDFPSSASVQQRVQKVIEKMAAFSRQELI